MTTNTVEEEKYGKLNDYIDHLETKEGALIMVLHKAQEIFGYLPEKVQNHIAHKLDIPAAKVYGTVTFYSYFNLKPKGKIQVNVCMGTACFIRGAQEVLDAFIKELGVKAGHTSDDLMFSLDALRCVGACGLAPVVSVNGKVYGKITAKDVKKIVEEHMALIHV